MRVDGLETALTAARVAVLVGRRDLALASPAGGGLSGGGGWWAALLARVRAAEPELTVTGLLDCLDSAGAALAALRAGCEDIVFDGPEPVAERLAAVAEAVGARLHRGPVAVFDPAGSRDPRAALAAHLREP
ncbi:MAG: hypothetical protein RID91_00545 [Azospirillaceae bacterium]